MGVHLPKGWHQVKTAAIYIPEGQVAKILIRYKGSEGSRIIVPGSSDVEIYIEPKPTPEPKEEKD